ncbi:MAG: hypothetical protein GY779_05190 [Gammaproteobacteria bacterium]|nr:hypothetical protein [Gammaproteobacteria bacterium]
MLLELNLIESIPALEWSTMKTEALPLGDCHWVWLDDELLRYITQFGSLGDVGNGSTVVSKTDDASIQLILELLNHKRNLVRGSD